jgi:hypothetical protein
MDTLSHSFNRFKFRHRGLTMRLIRASEMKLGDRIRICSESSPFNTMIIIRIDREYVYGYRPFIRSYDKDTDLCGTQRAQWFVPYTGYEEVILHVDSSHTWPMFD